MKRFLVLGLAVGSLSSFATAGTYFYNGSLGVGSPTFVNPSGDALGSQYYHSFEFTVTATGAYTFESASPNTSTGVSNALDTFLRVYQTTFNPLAPGTGIASNDDFTGTLTVLPGPYAGTITNTGTGFQNAQPSSRIASLNLTAGTTYYLINTSFRNTGFVNTGAVAAASGPYYTGISGVGDIQAVPEPATMAALGIGAVALLRRRKKA